MSDYIIKVLPTEACKKEHAPEGELTEGIECDGYVVLGFKDEKLAFETISGISIHMLKEYLVRNESVPSIIMQAAQIAEGYLKARETHKRHETKKSISSIAELLRSNLKDDDEEADSQEEK